MSITTDLDSVKKARDCIGIIFVIFEEILGKEPKTVYLDSLSSPAGYVLEIF